MIQPFPDPGTNFLLGFVGKMVLELIRRKFNMLNCYKAAPALNSSYFGRALMQVTTKPIVNSVTAACHHKGALSSGSSFTQSTDSYGTFTYQRLDILKASQD